MTEPRCFRWHLLVLAIASTISSVIVPSESFVAPTQLSSRNSFSHLRSNVAAEFVSQPTEDHDPLATKSENKKKIKGSKRLSRPERKALERQRKQKKKSGKQSKRSYKLNSEGISNLDERSTAEDVMRAIKRAQNTHDKNDIRAITDFLLGRDKGFAYGYRGSLLSRVVVAALHLEDHESARKALDTRKRDHQSTIDPMESAAVIRGLLRVHNVTQAMKVLDEELSLPEEVSFGIAHDAIAVVVVLLMPCLRFLNHLVTFARASTEVNN